ncbi:MAG: NAD(P)/FAD-dependent oxidoreductase [Sphingobacteriales bacterium]|nr:NAD(P)/FAD-dependent oxidoreductase [Sphingobacteriales bacterium]
MEDSNTWQLTDQHGKTTVVKMLILATGPLNRPNMPVFKGLENYKGKQFHSSAWDNSYDLTNKRVAIIGTGASAIQIIPNIAPIVGQLNVFSNNWFG